MWQSIAPRTLGQRLADKITTIIGTWTFIIIQTIIILGWTGYNLLIGKNGFDPYPFILLNLFLSFQAAYTAPAIMMSQKRKGEVDHYRAEIASNVNVKADLEIYALHDKIGHLEGDVVSAIKQQLVIISQQLEELKQKQP
ncbi:DUF1003 domain-containing protein [Biostraticola tofi]|uniref:Putative membrane protein n=1 Tax=Biostraticola tofi TaxID=466109 RepID=A0A4R3Z1P0_9GAMM|nr:DUF1003 domain-containing protein [Biostraticola tofi]TCV98915.1 putative membrane protein [Biostraticola tofi]